MKNPTASIFSVKKSFVSWNWRQCKNKKR